jgi:hypothetical protein
MPNTVRLKRSAVPAKVPLVGDLDLGELAINTYDGKLYTKKDDGAESIVEIGVGGSSNPPVPFNTQYATGAGPTLSANTEATVGTVTLTGVAVGSPVLIIARANLVKDSGTTIRTATVRVRRGTTNSDTQVGGDSQIRSTAVATTPFGPGTVIAQETAQGGGSVTYTVRAVADAACTIPAYDIQAVELKAVKGDTGDNGVGIDTALIQASENLAAGDFVNVHDSGGSRVRKASATAAGREVHGFVKVSVTSGNNATVFFAGTNDSVTGQTAGTVFMSATDGLATSTPPSSAGNVVQRIGFAISATAINFDPQIPVVLS